VSVEIKLGRLIASALLLLLTGCGSKTDDSVNGTENAENSVKQDRPEIINREPAQTHKVLFNSRRGFRSIQIGGPKK
jgi:hypothetical protein